MSLQTVSSCMNCANLMQDFQCGKHHTAVELLNSCEDHSAKASLHKSSSCSNCVKFGKANCANPTGAAPGMLCFAWAK